MRHGVWVAGTTAVVVLALLLCGCGQDSAAAGQVDVTITLFENGTQNGYPTYPAGSAGMVDVQLELDQGGFPLEGKQLTQNESFACNGQDLSILPHSQWAFEGDLPDAATFACTYTRDGTTTQISLTEPTRLRVLSPTPHGTIGRSGQGIPVRFTPALTAAQMRLGAYVSANTNPSADEYNRQVAAASGSDSVVVPASTIPTGVDAAYLNVVMFAPIAATASDFHSLSASFHDGVQMPLVIA